MSNPVSRPPLQGLILQGDKVVGGLELPIPHEHFVREFNHRYRRIGLQVRLQVAEAEIPVLPAQRRVSPPS